MKLDPWFYQNNSRLPSTRSIEIYTVVHFDTIDRKLNRVHVF